ncbi:hypothetical protein HFO55_27290 [Rhizobium leguminosarum]|nr:hypothetical protein [Rhizobium leguminosarum]MBY5570890.1 hypothetical protein [Rhizobium leguminosarum]MBY5577351.1 hypothetical protein [Rhizobium leguminosarum]
MPPARRARPHMRGVARDGSIHLRVAIARHLHRRHGKFDAVFLEGIADHRQRIAADDGLLAGFVIID